MSLVCLLTKTGSLVGNQKAMKESHSNVDAAVNCKPLISVFMYKYCCINHSSLDICVL